MTREAAATLMHEGSRHRRGLTSIFETEIRGRGGEIKHSSRRSNLRTTGADWRSCLDWQTAVMGGSFNVGEAGTATASSSTSLTNSGAAFPTTNNGYKGHIVACGPNASGAGSTVYGVITNNTATVLTVDQWYVPGTPGGAAGTTPNATCTYQVLPGNAPAWWLALSTDSGAPSASDTSLASEITTNGLQRAIWGAFAHTSGATSFTMTKVFSATGTSTINKEAVFNAQSGGAMPFESAEPNPPTVQSGDTLTQNVSINI